MVTEYLYSPHYDFYIDFAERTYGYDMKSFHFHKKYEIYYEVKGTRRYFIDNSTYIVNAGNIVLIGPDSIHKTGSVENMPHSRYVLNFNFDYITQIGEISPDVNLHSCFESGVHIIQVSPRKQRIIESLMYQMWETHASNLPKDIALRKLRLSEMLLILGDYASEVKQGYDAKVTNPIIEKVQSYIAVHYKEPLRLSAISKEFFVSDHYLSRLFKKTTGLSVIEYINSIRLTAAKDLLETTQTSISRIGEAVGFGTTTHFSRAFKESAGLSPQQYRKIYNAADKDSK